MMVGNGVKLLMERAIGKELLESGEVDFDRVFQDFRNHYMVHNLDETAPYPGIMDMLKELKARGKNIADAMQCGCTLLGAQGLPGVRRLGARLDESVDRLVRGECLRAGTHGFDAPRRGRDRRSNLTGPLPIGGEGGI